MDVFTAVAEPTRRAILDLLGQGEQPAGRLVERFPAVTQPAISRHLRILLEVGLVTVRPEAQRRIYALSPRRLAEIDAWLRPYQRFWEERFAALDRHLARPHGRPAAAPLSPTRKSPASSRKNR